MHTKGKPLNPVEAKALADKFAPGFEPNELPLDRLYRRLGYPRWFWPLVMSILFVVIVLGGALVEQIHA